MPEVVVSHPGEETLAFVAAQQAFELFFATLVKTSPELMRLWQRKQPEAKGTFLVQGGEKKPRTRSSSLFSHRLCLLINCLDLIHFTYNSAGTRSNNNIKMHLHTSLCLHYFASVSSQFPNVILFKEVILRKMTFSAL